MTVATSWCATSGSSRPRGHAHPLVHLAFEQLLLARLDHVPQGLGVLLELVRLLAYRQPEATHDELPERVGADRVLEHGGRDELLADALIPVSTLGPERTVRGIRERDLAVLSSVSGIGRKKAERLVLELQDRFDDVALAPVAPRTSGTDEAVRALVALGYAPAAADDAVRAAQGGVALEATSQLIRRALQQRAGTRAGR